jgi:hypothetical protein
MWAWTARAESPPPPGATEPRGQRRRVMGSRRRIRIEPRTFTLFGFPWSPLRKQRKASSVFNYSFNRIGQPFVFSVIFRSL